MNNKPKLQNNMKTKILLFIALTLVLGCCSDDNSKPASEIDKLPPATQVGANTAGCLVNGKAFLPQGYVPAGNLRCNYINGLNFTLSIVNNTQNTIKSINIFCYNTTIEIGQTYSLLQNNNNSNSKYAEYIINSTPPPSPYYYSTNEIIAGELTVTHHDFDNAVLSGTFWFDAINSEGEIVEVREGRFDVEY
jgi:hypothetical protein